MAHGSHCFSQLYSALHARVKINGGIALAKAPKAVQSYEEKDSKGRHHVYKILPGETENEHASMTDAVNMFMTRSDDLRSLCKASGGVFQQLVSYFEKVDDPAFPFIQFDAMVKAFRNGNLVWHQKDVKHVLKCPHVFLHSLRTRITTCFPTLTSYQDHRMLS